MNIAELADLLHETAERHDPFEKSGAPTTGGTGTPPTWPPARTARTTSGAGATWRSCRAFPMTQHLALADRVSAWLNQTTGPRR